MARSYELKKRAEKQEQTRQRIIEAVVELHGSVGPAQTTISAIAEKAGVQRLTVYRHFPDDRELYSACTAHWAQQNPRPDPGVWLEIVDPVERLLRALDDLYAFNERTEQMQAHAQRDAVLIPALAEAQEPFQREFEHLHQVLQAGWNVDAEHSDLFQAALAHALSFATWQSLVREQRLSQEQAVELMVRLVRCAAGEPAPAWREASSGAA